MTTKKNPADADRALSLKCENGIETSTNTADGSAKAPAATTPDPRAAKPIDVALLTASDTRRLWAKIERTGQGWPCWLWKGHRERTGYALFESKGLGRVAVHRLVYTLMRGPIPAGLTLDHRCRVRHCCNPVHLESVSSAENTLRGDGATAKNARKTHCVHGHALTSDNVRIETDRLGRSSRKCRECNRAKLAAKRRAVAAAGKAGGL